MAMAPGREAGSAPNLAPRRHSHRVSARRSDRLPGASGAGPPAPTQLPPASPPSPAGPGDCSGGEAPSSGRSPRGAGLRGIPPRRQLPHRLPARPGTAAAARKSLRPRPPRRAGPPPGCPQPPPAPVQPGRGHPLARTGRPRPPQRAPRPRPPLPPAARAAGPPARCSPPRAERTRGGGGEAPPARHRTWGCRGSLGSRGGGRGQPLKGQAPRERRTRAP